MSVTELSSTRCRGRAPSPALSSRPPSRPSPISVRLAALLGGFLAALLMAAPAPGQTPATPVPPAPAQATVPPPSGAAALAASGSVAGHVRGPGGVAVPGATILLVNPQTGARRETWSDSEGNYVLRGVAPGTYRLEVSLVGFQTDVREPVPMTTGRALKLNVALDLARGAAETGGTQAATAGAAGNHPPGAPGGRPDWTELTPEERQRLQDALHLRPGQSRGPGGAGGSTSTPEAGGAESDQGAVRFSESGGQGEAAPTAAGAGGEGEADATSAQASAANSFLLSGSVAEAPTPGQREQVRQRFEQYRDEQQGAPGFGGGGGGPGGGGRGGFGEGGGFGVFIGMGGRRPRVNRLRGNLFERYGNSALDALPYPLNTSQNRQIASYSEQAGFSIGGPLYIPHLLNSRDKTSFFVNYNLQRSRSPFDSYATVPTALERSGDFSGTLIPSGPLAGTAPLIYEPQSGPPGPRTAFPGDAIPSSMMNPAALGLLKYIPLPNLPGSVQNFHLQEALPAANDRLMARVGRQISSKDNLSVFYFFNSSRSNSVSAYPSFTSNSSARGQNVNLSESHTFSPQIVNSFTFNFSRQRVSTLNPFAFTNDVAGALGIAGVSEDPLNWGVPLIDFTNFGALSLPIPSLTRNQTARAVDSVTLNRGQHNLRFGGEVRRVQLNSLTDPNARGTFTFTGYTTSDFGASGLPVAGTGFDFADFLLGLPQATSERFGTSANYLRSWVSNGFVQDDWRAASKLTFVYGLRYEYFQPFTEKYGHLADLDLGAGFSSADIATGLNPGALPESLLRGDGNNLAPRVGLAYRPSLKRQLVLRAGFGVFYDGSIYTRLVPNLENQPPFAQASTLLTSPGQVLTLQNGFPAPGPNTLTNTYAVDPHFRTPYAQTWNLNLQDEVARNVILTVGYVGTKGTKLDLLLGPNPAGSLNTPNALQYDYETSGASSIYQALQVSVRRQFRRGLSLWGRYTFSKSIDDAAAVGGQGGGVAQNYLDVEAERGLSTFDRTHQFVLNYNYELPFGDRKRFLNHGGLAERAFGNWQISGVTTLESGTPSTARVLGNLGSAGTGAYFALRADATGLPVSLPSGERNALQYFNTGAFTLPPAGQLGNAGRDTIPGPALAAFNMSLDRQLVFSRERGLTGDFRIEANNLFNTPNFSSLATVVNATSFGRVTGVGGMRTLSLSLRVRF